MYGYLLLQGGESTPEASDTETEREATPVTESTGDYSVFCRKAGFSLVKRQVTVSPNSPLFPEFTLFTLSSPSFFRIHCHRSMELNHYPVLVNLAGTHFGGNWAHLTMLGELKRPVP